VTRRSATALTLRAPYAGSGTVVSGAAERLLHTLLRSRRQGIVFNFPACPRGPGPVETPYATYPHGDVRPRALVAAGATANPVRHGTVPDLAAAVVALAGGANGPTGEIAGWSGDPAVIAPALNWPNTSPP